MVNRIIKHDLIESDRWLDLPTDTHRLVYENLLLLADDYGNFEGGRRLHRWIRTFTQTKLDADAIKLMSDLQDADLVRRYEADEKEYWHLPRFYNSRWYWGRNCPKSPYQDDIDNPRKHRVGGKSVTHVANMLTTCAEEVEVEVEEEVKERRKTKAARAAPLVLPDWIPKPQWDAWIEARTKSKKAPTEWAKKLAVRRLEDLRDRGHSPALVLAESAFNNWSGLFEPKGQK